MLLFSSQLISANTLCKPGTVLAGPKCGVSEPEQPNTVRHRRPSREGTETKRRRRGEKKQMEQRKPRVFRVWAKSK